MPQNDEEMIDARRSLTKQVFQLAYFGKISPEYASSLEVSERNQLYKFLEEQLKEEKKQHEKEESKAKSQASRIKNAPKPRRR